MPYTTGQVAKKLGYSQSATVRQLIQNGKINATRVGDFWLISEHELARLKKEGYGSNAKSNK